MAAYHCFYLLHFILNTWILSKNTFIKHHIGQNVNSHLVQIFHEPANLTPPPLWVPQACTLLYDSLFFAVLWKLNFTNHKMHLIIILCNGTIFLTFLSRLSNRICLWCENEFGSKDTETWSKPSDHIQMSLVERLLMVMVNNLLLQPYCTWLWL